jgi:predicted nuclease of predicted toxin-antitoxin system
LRVIIDAQLPPALADMLTSLGFDAHHVRAMGLLSASDDEIWRAGRDQQAAILTKDEDFAARVQREGPPPQVVWVRLGNTTNRSLLPRMAALWSQVQTALERGEGLIEIR